MSADSTVRIWDAETSQCLHILNHTDPVLALAWNREGKMLASGSMDNVVRIWDAETAQCVISGLTLGPNDMGVFGSVVWSNDSKRIMTANVTLKTWDSSTLEAKEQLESGKSKPRMAIWSPDETRIASPQFGEGNNVQIWDSGLTQCLLNLEGHTAGVESVDWSPDQTEIVTGSADNTAKIWDAASGKCLSTLSHDDTVFAVAWCQKSSRIVTAGSEKMIKIWDV
ncbi:WD40-repeat-containing domain protein, partial [Trichoderma velutinum]